MNFDKYSLEANRYLKELAGRLGNEEDTDHAFRVTNAVLHTVREILTPEESLHFISQMPMYLKALYVEGWKLTVEDRIRTMDEFIESLEMKTGRTYARDFGNMEQAIQKVRAVFDQLQQYVSPGEMDDVLAQWPSELCELWPSEVK